MHTPNFDEDGWCLEDGEERNRLYPETFQIPDLEVRQALKPGDFAKLIFRVAVEGDEPDAVSRMWVIVRETIPGGYLGILDNKPDSITENDRFWIGAELPFEYRHIISVGHANETSRAIACGPPTIPWRR